MINKLKLLIAEDNTLFRRILLEVLGSDYDITLAHDGEQAWEMLQQLNAPRLAILDWVTPGLSGPQVCRNVKSYSSTSSMYLIILTSKNSEADIVSGLRAGADDYITKPFIATDLRTRVRIGERVLALQDSLDERSIRASQAASRENLLHESTADCPLRNKLASVLEWHVSASLIALSCRYQVARAESAFRVDPFLTQSLEKSNS